MNADTWWKFMDIFALMLPCGYCRLSVHRCLAEVHRYAKECQHTFFYSRLAFVLRRMVESKLLCQDLTRLCASKHQGIQWSQEIQPGFSQHAWYHIQHRYLAVSVDKHLALTSSFWKSVINLAYLIHADLPQCHRQEMHRIPNFALRVYAIRHYFEAVQSLLPKRFHCYLNPFIKPLPLHYYLQHNTTTHDTRTDVFTHLFGLERQSKLADPEQTLQSRLETSSAASVPPWGPSASQLRYDV
jgi:hypothetical protein